MRNNKIIITLIVFTMLTITSCSKDKMYTCTCTFTFNNPSQFNNPSPTIKTMYYGSSKSEAQKAYNANHGNNGTSTGDCIISED